MQLDLTNCAPQLDLKELSKQVRRDLNVVTREHFEEEEMRSHLGASVIGNKCARAVWYDWRWINRENLDGRKHRLFDRGNLEETRNAKWFELMGFRILSEQERVSFGFGDHGGGSSDKIVLLPEKYGYSEPVLVEEKTHNEKSFREHEKSGVRKAKPQHFVQSCVYAKMLGIKLVLYWPVSKNNDDVLPEFLWVDEQLAEDTLRKADDIITAQSPPRRAHKSKTHFECKSYPCTHYSTCWENAGSTERNCRSCKNASAGQNKTWVCSLHGVIPKEFIPKGCDSWEDIAHG